MGLYKVIDNFLIKVNKSVKINNYINYFFSNNTANYNFKINKPDLITILKINIISIKLKYFV